jgi:hypothetical protein
MMPLAESTDAILDAMVDAVRAETQPGGLLEGVKAVVNGDRERPMPKLPAIWVIPQLATFAQETFGDEETWSMLVSIAALVKSDDPATGSRLALEYSSRARRPVLAVRPASVAITDIRSETFDPAARSSEQNRNLFWTDATVRVVFTVLEE